MPPPSLRSHDETAGRRMDRIYRTQRKIYDLTRRYYLLGRTRLQCELTPPDEGNVLEIGCGTAWNLIRCAQRYPRAKFCGIDISSEMLKTAKGNVGARDLEHRIALANGDACHFSPEKLFGIATFDRIILSYCLSMIPEWPRVLDHAARLLAPGGQITIADFGPCDKWPEGIKRTFFAWLAKYAATPRPDLETVIAETAQRHGLVSQFETLYGGYTVYAVMTRPLTA